MIGRGTHTTMQNHDESQLARRKASYLLVDNLRCGATLAKAAAVARICVLACYYYFRVRLCECACA